MAPFGKVYSYPNNFRVLRMQVIAALNGLELEFPEFQMGVTNKSPEFLAKFPLGKVPTFEGADGFLLVENAAIAEYLAASGPKAAQLLGENAQTRAKITEWTVFTESELVANANPWLFVLLKFAPYDEAQHGKSAAAFERALGKVETAVKGGKKFLVGDQLTLADLMVSAALFFSSGFLLDAEMRKNAPATVEYLKGIASTPEFAKAFGKFKPCEVRYKGE
ncbi:glutathione S-transferase [Cryphonectria parasitica EP155]|uniref:Glutathione S-transferase n=1 Tax=Cryphonectria parasitica (strain ATCC 38755 / EP155) TaxID=660469 RepID=A0A9P4YAM4_CRYP1|nr:glutathione S-transferase [Cryphonectria parasitica EP155]KAF3769155.1 glutathione S-transferase [Cryphonectria parasitica EP155]